MCIFSYGKILCKICCRKDRRQPLERNQIRLPIYIRRPPRMALHFTNGTYTSLSEIEYKRFLDQGIPATICLSFLCIVGTIGNIHMILIFKISPVMTKYSIRVFIIWLSLTDLIACLFCMPLEIYNIRYSYTTSISGCKFFIFLFHVVALASSGFWTTIAVERYRIIVKKVPILFLNSQRSNNVISAVVVGVSLALSIPVVILFGPNEIKTVIPGLTGKDCTVLSQYLNIHNAGIYYIIILSTLCSVFAVVCIVSYGRVLWDICNGIKIRKSLRGKSSSSFNSPTHTRFGNTHVNSSIQNEEIQTIHVPAEMGHRTNTSHNLENSLRLIVSLMIATTVSYIAYMLFVCMIMVKLLNPKLYKTTIQPVTAILLRGYFGSNTSNAFVFCLFDRNFRQEWLKLYRKIRSKIISRRLETV